MTNEELILRSVGEIVERLVARFSAQASDHETKMAEHRAAFGARTEADRKIIAGLREESAKCQAELDDLYQREGIEKKRRMDVEDERDGLLTQMQDMRAETEQVQVSVVGLINERNEAWERCDALRAEVAALQERLRASIARGDFAQMEVAALKSQTPKHPVKVGEWVRRTNRPGDQSPVGIVKQVTSIRHYGYSYGFADRDCWSSDNCEPCDPPQTVPVPKRHPVVVGGYLRRLTGFNTTPAGEVARVTLVDDDDSSQIEYEVVRPNGEKGRWSAKGCDPCDPPATHDTPEGRSVAESVIRDGRKTEPVAEEIKVGVEVVGRSAPTFATIGYVDLDNSMRASLKDVRKVTT